VRLRNNCCATFATFYHCKVSNSPPALIQPFAWMSLPFLQGAELRFSPFPPPLFCMNLFIFLPFFCCRRKLCRALGYEYDVYAYVYTYHVYFCVHTYRVGANVYNMYICGIRRNPCRAFGEGQGVGAWVCARVQEWRRWGPGTGVPLFTKLHWTLNWDLFYTRSLNYLQQ
jgi:hypothetical protein